MRWRTADNQLLLFGPKIGRRASVDRAGGLLKRHRGQATSGLQVNDKIAGDLLERWRVVFGCGVQLWVIKTVQSGAVQRCSNTCMRQTMRHRQEHAKYSKFVFPPRTRQTKSISFFSHILPFVSKHLRNLGMFQSREVIMRKKSMGDWTRESSALT